MPTVLASLLLAFGQLADPAIWRILVKSVLVSLVLFVLIGTGGWWLIDGGLAAAGLTDPISSEAGALRGAAAALLTAIGFWLTWRIVAMAVVQFFADEVVEAVEARHYPHAALTEPRVPLGEQVSASMAAAARTLVVNLVALPIVLALLVTGIGTALLFFFVNAWLIGRELQEMVWLRHTRAPGQRAPVTAGERLVLGGAVAALLVVPLASFLAPVLGAAGATHLVHRKARA